MTGTTEDFWRGEFGDSYTERNKIDWRNRVDFFKDVLDFTAAKTVLEVGCNSGHNLLAIKMINPKTYVHGIEINPEARRKAAEHGIQTSDIPAAQVGQYFEGYDLVFSAGLLIHIHPDQLRQVMQGMIDASSHYIIAIEYAAKSEVEIDYRGHSERLWKRPYGKLFEELGVEVTDWGDAGSGFDRCDYWVMEKRG